MCDPDHTHGPGRRWHGTLSAKSSAEHTHTTMTLLSFQQQSRAVVGHCNSKSPFGGWDLFELAVLLFRHDLFHGVAGTYAQGPWLDALQGHVGAEREPLVNHLALLQTVQLATHEHWEGERLRCGGRRREDGRYVSFKMKKGDEVEAYRNFTDGLTDVTFFALFCFVAQADLKSVDFTR